MFQRWLAKPEGSFLLIGPRRSGKTTFLRETWPEVAYCTLDDFDYLDVARRDPKALFPAPGRTLIIDEIQRVPELTIAVKYALDNLGYRVMLTGSSRIGLLDSAADTLAGRISIRHCPTACWGEDHGAPTHAIFEQQADPLQLRAAARELEEVLLHGSFPEVLTTPPEQRTELLRRYRDTYFTRDLAQLSALDNLDGLRAMLQHFGRSLGSRLAVSNFAREAALSHPTAKKYLGVLFQSDLAFRLLGYQYGPAKRYLRAMKCYFADVGMITALRLQLSAGQILEQFVLSELEKRRKLGFYDCEQLYYYSSTSGAEIDLILEEPEVTRAVEIKTTTAPSRAA